MDTIWTFETARFTVRCIASYDRDPDLSWRDADQVEYDAADGVEYFNFDIVVTLDGDEIARDSLGGSGYANPSDFVREHRDPNSMNRNCTIRREAHDTIVGHYFPDMVRTAVREARNAPERLRSVPLRSDRLRTDIPLNV